MIKNLDKDSKIKHNFKKEKPPIVNLCPQSKFSIYG